MTMFSMTWNKTVNFMCNLEIRLTWQAIYTLEVQTELISRVSKTWKIFLTNLEQIEDYEDNSKHTHLERGK